MTDYEKYIIARWCYAMGKPIMSDPEYTVLHRSLKASMPDDVYVNRSWSSDPCPVELLRKYNMESYINNVIVLDKTDSMDSLCSLYEVQKEFADITEGRCSVKEDGWNFQVNYYNHFPVCLHQRGRNTDDFIERPALLEKVPAYIPDAGRVRVVLEGTVSDEVFYYCKDKYGNDSQRGAVSTLLANPEDVHLLTLHATGLQSDIEYPDIYKTLTEWGFTTPEYRRVQDYESLVNAMEDLSNMKNNLGIPSDGLVITDGVKTKAARVLAWEEPIYRSYVTGYTEETNSYRISVGVTIYPIKLANGTQRNIPCTNINRLISNHLEPGAPVAFRFVSGAIADLDADSTRLIQQEYAGRYGVYQAEIEENERQKIFVEEQKALRYSSYPSSF